jgi:hypothetical protein
LISALQRFDSVQSVAALTLVRRRFDLSAADKLISANLLVKFPPQMFTDCIDSKAVHQ